MDIDIAGAFKGSPLQVKIVTIYNLICALLAGSLNFSFSLGYLSILLITILLFIITYFLLKKKRWAFVLMLIWFAIQSAYIVFRNVNLSLHYGPTLYWSWQTTYSYKDTGDISYGLGVNFPPLILFFILLSAKRFFRNHGVS
jgi:hypothetical protein